MHDSNASRRFLRIATLTLGAIYFLILVGGIVRASGAGMGCPDWPTCFGRWIPPTQEAELPPDYHTVYAERGYADTAFNPVKTWTEYVNRLIGASIGVLIFLTLLRSIPLRKDDPPVFYGALGTFLLVGIQAWLGSAVVKSNLQPVMITAHMVMAFLIVCLLIFAITRAQREQLETVDIRGLPSRFQSVLIAAMVMTLLQITMGTQVRESVDVIANLFQRLDRHLWREDFPVIFYVHRSFSSVILLTNLWLIWKILTGLDPRHPFRKWALTLGGLIVTAILTGISLDRLGFPAVVQPVHLLLANLIFGTQFFLYRAYRYARQVAETEDEDWQPSDLDRRRRADMALMRSIRGPETRGR